MVRGEWKECCKEMLNFKTQSLGLDFNMPFDELIMSENCKLSTINHPFRDNNR